METADFLVNGARFCITVLVTIETELFLNIPFVQIELDGSHTLKGAPSGALLGA